jgi:hypothetical protein
MSHLLMEWPLAMTNSARKRFNPVRHPARAVGQKHLSACFVVPLGSRHSEGLKPKLKEKGAQNMRALLTAWMLGMLVMALVSKGSEAQTSAKKMGETPGVIPSGLGEAVDHDIMAIREATAQFKTTEAAEAAGYKQVTGCVEHQPAGAMGYHFQNNDLLDTTLDLEHPEVLVYEKMSDGSFQLNGVEFLVPISAWKSSKPPLIMGQALTKADSIGFWFLHVWTWKPSPSGLFAPWNPDVKCLGASSMNH